MKIPFQFLSVFWHKYIPVLRKTSRKKGQSVKPKANDNRSTGNTHNKLIK